MKLGRLATASVVSVAAILIGAQAPAVAGKPAAPTNGSSAYVRVNQVGYPDGRRLEARVPAVVRRRDRRHVRGQERRDHGVLRRRSARTSARGARRLATSTRWTSRR